MAQLVGDHTLKLVAGDLLEQPARHRDGGVFGVAARGKRVGIRIGNRVHPGLRQARRDAHLLDDVVELANPVRVVRTGGAGKGAIERHRAGGEQHRAVSGVVAGQSRHAADPERGQTADGERELAFADVKHVEAEPQKQQKPDEDHHDRPGAPAVRRLLLVEIPRQTYFLIERSTAGTCRSVASVISNSSDGLKPNAEANMLEGNVCWAVLNVVAMSL